MRFGAPVPFDTRSEAEFAIIPVGKPGHLHDNPAAVNGMWKETEVLWTEHRSHGKNNPGTLLARIDCGSALSARFTT